MQEIQELNPGVVLVIAGAWWWKHFITEQQGCDIICTPREGAVHVPQIGVDGAGRRWIFTNRPEREAETAFRAELVDAYEQAARLMNRDNWTAQSTPEVWNQQGLKQNLPGNSGDGYAVRDNGPCHR